MRIAIDGMLLSPPYSGVENAISGLVVALESFGTEDYTLFAPKSFPSAQARKNRIRSHCCPVTTNRKFMRIAWEQLFLPRLLVRGGFDLLHAPGYVCPLASRVPVVLTVYDLIALRRPELSRGLNSLHFRLLLPASVRKARKVIVPSEATRRDLIEKLGVQEKKIALIPLGVDGRFRPVKDRALLSACRAKYGLSGDFILCVGNLEPKKNLKRALRAFGLARRRAGRELKLAVVGRKGWKSGGIEREAAASEFRGDIVFTGYVPDEDLPALYSAAECLLFPSLCEGFGLPVLEAMACAAPVVASRTPAVAETAGGAAVLVDPLDEGDIAAGLGRVLGDKGLRGELAARGMARAALFSWRAAAEKTEAVYRAAAARS